MDNQLRYGVNLFLPLYVPSKCIISFVDLMHFIKSDCHLKIAYIIFNLNCSMLCYHGTKGSGFDKSEHVQLFPIECYANEPDLYIKNVNSLFFLKPEVSKCINEDSWITFNRNNEEIIYDKLKKTIYTLCNHKYNIDYNYKHRFSFYTCGDEVTFFNQIDTNYTEIECEFVEKLSVNYLDEYTSNLDGYVDMFQEAKNFFKNNAPQNNIEEINVIKKMKDKFRLSDKKIAMIVYESELDSVDIDTLAKRIHRKLKAGES